MNPDDFWKNKLVLITGANGFLGSHLTVAFLKNNAKVIGFIKEDRERSYFKIALEKIRKPKIKIIKSDIINFKSVFWVFKNQKPDICLHVAARPIVGIANKTPIPTFKTNIMGTWNILEAARLCWTSAVVVASSDKAYGEHKRLPYTEDSPLLAKHPYDASKACADILTRSYAHTYGLNTAVTRCANIFGPGDFNFSRIIPDTIRSVILNKDPVIRSDGSPLRDYIFIDDVVAGYLELTKQLYEGKIKKGEVFNFGTRSPVSVKYLVDKILKIAKKSNLKAQILSKTKIKGEIDKQYLSSEKAWKELKWKSRISLEDGLRKTLGWYTAYLKY